MEGPSGLKAGTLSDWIVPIYIDYTTKIKIRGSNGSPHRVSEMIKEFDFSN